MSGIKFYGIENPHHHVRNFLSAITLKGIDKDIFHIIFPWMFSCNANLLSALGEPQSTKQEELKGKLF